MKGNKVKGQVKKNVIYCIALSVLMGYSRVRARATGGHDHL
jgi:hypothetical protein